MPPAATAPHLPHRATGKQAADENFPVGSILLPRSLRPAVHEFYRFARKADDIADNPTLSIDEKLIRLDEMENHLPSAGAPHARTLLDAFRRDALNPPCRDWAELIEYCRLSAMPVGRFLLDLHGEGTPPHHASDALCAALQILNHLQDCREDYVEMGRVYLPRNWLPDPSVLDAPAASPELRKVLDRCLDGVDALLAEARPLPRLIAHRRLRMEAAVILDLARRLTLLLRKRDPLAGPVKLRRRDKAAALLTGLAAL
ncbi:squalene/phytoene synthase family protein [Telmatospirillum sp. J64-1]|uniref:squalene/phytoene synthase family protein n=1 Tax=Telmatospirillum sp. J64-1 TaxID=2502183 RepID=UPI00115CFA9B|nr:squalene/phytoene synthase family protein [Telmatospirillum sp. J64-1]